MIPLLAVLPLLAPSRMRMDTSWVPLAKAVAAVGRRLSPPDATAHVHRTADLILEICSATPLKNKPYDQRAWARALLPLCGGLDAARSARVADTILAILGDSAKPLVDSGDPVDSARSVGDVTGAPGPAARSPRG